MFLKKLKELPLLPMAGLILVFVCAITLGNCGDTTPGGSGTPTPSAADYDISDNLIQPATGTINAVTVTPKEGKSTGERTVWYTGINGTEYPKSQTVPSNPGTYSVTFDVAEAEGWNAASNLSAGELVIGTINFMTGTDALSWGVSNQANVLTLTLQPGDDTTKINLNWYSTGAVSGKVAQVRFVRGTFSEGAELIEVTTGGTVIDASAGNSAHKATVTGLKAGASYQYAVSSDGTNWSIAYDFKVPAASGAFKFAVIADPQINQTVWDPFNRYTPTAGANTASGWLETVAKMVSHGVSFIASGGDQVDTSNTTTEAEYTSLFAPPGMRSLPFAPVSGNHDTNTGFQFHYNWPGQDNSTTLPTNSVDAKRNYYYLYNKVLFVVLDTAPGPGSTSAATPFITKFDEVIKAAKAANVGKYDWLIVQHHKSTASVAVHLADRDIQYYVEAGFERIMSENGVDFVLAGHDHVYARSYPLQGLDGGQVSRPDKTKSSTDGHTVTNPGNPIYLTFTTGSGLKYYSVYVDTQFDYTAHANPKIYVNNNVAYPYLGDILEDNGYYSTKKGSVDWLAGNAPVSNAAWVQPYIPSYSICEVNGKTITFRTYAIATVSGTSKNAEGNADQAGVQPYSYNADTAYDWVTVTKN
jgi:hypothetical protein